MPNNQLHIDALIVQLIKAVLTFSMDSSIEESLMCVRGQITVSLPYICRIYFIIVQGHTKTTGQKY